MKKLVATLCLTALITGAYAQGLVKFQNSASTLISYETSPGVFAVTPPSALTAPGYYYALLSAPLGSVDLTQFVYAGVYATNTTSTTGGRLAGGSALGVNCNSTWPAVTTRSFLVVGWSADQGATYNPVWMEPGTFHGVTGTPGGWFGFSAIASGMAGGLDTSTQANYPALALFAGTTIASGFTLYAVPEPTTMALAGLGAAALLIFRRRK